MASINTFGEVNFKHANTDFTKRLTITEISGYRSMWTFYSNVGFVFDYFFMGLGPVWWLLCILVSVKPDWAKRMLGYVGVEEEKPSGYRSCTSEEERDDDIQGVIN